MICLDVSHCVNLFQQNNKFKPLYVHSSCVLHWNSPHFAWVIDPNIVFVTLHFLRIVEFVCFTAAHNWQTGDGEHYVAKADFDFTSQTEEELSFKSGQRITIAPKGSLKENCCYTSAFWHYPATSYVRL